MAVVEYIHIKNAGHHHLLRWAELYVSIGISQKALGDWLIKIHFQIKRLSCEDIGSPFSVASSSADENCGKKRGDDWVINLNEVTMPRPVSCWWIKALTADETKKTPISCSVQLSVFIFFGELFLSIDWSAGLCKYELINPLESFPSKNQFHRAIILCPDFRQRGRQERPVSNGSSDLCTLMMQGCFLCGTEKCLDCVLPSLPLLPSESGGWRINRKPPEADANGMLMPMVRPSVCAELGFGVWGWVCFLFVWILYFFLILCGHMGASIVLFQHQQLSSGKKSGRKGLSTPNGWTCFNLVRPFSIAKPREA